MADGLTIPIASKPGVQRDGTQFDCDAYADSEWVRFRRGKPRKMLGYRRINRYVPEISRGMHAYPVNDLTYVHTGGENYLQQVYIDDSNNTSVFYDRTPAGYAANPLNAWMFDTMFSTGVGNYLIGHVAPRLDCLCDTGGGAIYVGDLTATTALTAVTVPAGADASGGIVVLHPYLFYFGAAGSIGHSVPGDPSDLSGAGSSSGRYAGQKVVRGLPLRSQGGPSGLFWTANELVRATFSGGTTIFNYDTISSRITVMSPSAVIEMDGIYYWLGIDRPLMFNGVVREIPNSFNWDWFLNELNHAYAQKVWAMAVPRFGEIWWCFPRGTSTECNHAIILNVRENCWYDTPLPDGGRSSGTDRSTEHEPILFGVDEDVDGYYKMWMHEIGVNAIDGDSEQPIRSYFETAPLAFPLLDPQAEGAVLLSVVEPDFVQTGDMTAQILGKANARAPDVVSNVITFPADADGPSNEILRFNTQRRLMRMRFESNAIGGYYEMGKPLLHITPGDERITS